MAYNIEILLRAIPLFIFGVLCILEHANEEFVNY